ncbi:peptide ABC transporter substrate-binding protein [Bdellovibrio sp. 22V]|uniref:peptide ABC transporter substrate-binding protein n=1 Tax=Bdellovibrio sp. 22V TaxID=3044166 RepID=UPI00254336D6|nr:peptide ABC transporter substrate-binding protein [Bdellovibrio sp. 22V]WII70999.1 peptide ABC transporter substrate-binding protein [Bdellovibrio sp. 22V]
MKIFLAILLWASGSLAAEKVFRLHLANEPGGLDPNKQRTSASSYLLGNLYRNLFTFDDKKGLVPDLALGCKCDKKKNLICTLKKDLKWSDGSPLLAQDFLRTYKKILNAKTAAPRADLLFKIKNAEDIYSGKKNMESLGVTAPNELTLKFEFQTPDPDFEYNLANFLLAPTKENLSVYSGPYKMREWKKGHKIVLEPNTQYKFAHPARPVVEFLFVEEDTIALQLYEKNELQFLRRLPTLFIPKYKTRTDFYWIPVTRLDYLGFGPDLAAREDVREALTYSLNYVELQKIFSSEGKPGCIGLPDSWFPEKAPCFDFDLKKVPKVQNSPTYTLMFSALGGEDHKRATEWLQNQWSKNAGINTHLEVKENKVFLQILAQKPPAIFRKGVAPDRPTCLAALETFSPSSPENYLRIKSDDYQKILSSLANAANTNEQKKWCLKGAQYLMENHLMIPLGAIHFSMLAKPEFVGWKLNQMNQLDLSDLHPKP